VDQEHQEIFDCVVARDLEGAQAVLSQHISNVKRQVLQSLRQMLDEDKDLISNVI
jgi:DNA-binding GntR family transcriptional regulator